MDVDHGTPPCPLDLSTLEKIHVLSDSCPSRSKLHGFVAGLTLVFGFVLLSELFRRRSSYRERRLRFILIGLLDILAESDGDNSVGNE
jgi:hypothetical protein